MKNYSFFVGVDISKNSLDICQTDGNQMQHLVINNKTTAIANFLKKVNVNSTLFCMEDTGVYGMHLYCALENAQIDYAVIPAIQIKRSKGLQRGKSDKTDAMDIANYARIHQHDIHLYQLPEADFQELKLLLAEREKLVKAVKQFEGTQENYSFLDKKVCASLKKLNQKTINQLNNQLAQIERTIEDVIKRNSFMNEQMQLLQSIPGIGPQTALWLMAFTRCFKTFDNWRQLACYAGVAPFPYQSGKSIKGKTKVSHFAQKKLKSALHLASLSAKKHDVELKKYFDRKVEEGKNKMSVLNAVRCKLIARAFAVIHRGTPFVNTQKFAA